MFKLIAYVKAFSIITSAFIPVPLLAYISHKFFPFLYPPLLISSIVGCLGYLLIMPLSLMFLMAIGEIDEDACRWQSQYWQWKFKRKYEPFKKLNEIKEE